MGRMADRHEAHLGTVRETLFIPLPSGPLRRQLPARYRYLLPLADPILGKVLAITLFRARS